SNPQDTFNILLSLTQTFIRFAPDSELIYDDIQQFARKLKDAIDECFTCLDQDTIQQSSQLLHSTHQSLLAIIQQQNNDNTSYTNMYKNMSAVLTNLQKINSLPIEIQNVSSSQNLDATIPVEIANKQETTKNMNGHSVDSHEHNGQTNGCHSIAVTNGLTTNQPQKSPTVSYQPTQNSMVPPSTTSITTKLMNQMKNITSSEIPITTVPNVTSASASQAMSTISYLSEYEITDTMEQMIKKPTATIASFPPRQLSTIDTQSKLTAVNKDENLNRPDAETPSHENDIRFGTTFKAQTIPTLSANRDDEDNDEKARQYYLDPYFCDPYIANSNWQPTKDYLSIVVEQSHLNHTTAIVNSHITDEYIQEYGDKQNRPPLRGDLYMNYGTPQSGPQATCLPIGVGLSYDELTLLSCDVHRNSQNVRLFDIQTGRLKHTITGNQQMKFHRPSAVMSNARNNILIVERDYIYITEPDGRLVQTIGHRSIKQLYGIALFRDRYLLTIDSKATDNQTAENSRLLLFDPSSGQLVFEKPIVINRESEDILKEQNINHIQGKILPETTSKPRFLAVHNDNIYIADLGRSLIYGTSIRNQFEYSCTTVFGGQGRASGEMNDPSGLVIDSGGNIISADSKNDRLQIFSSNGEYKTTLKLNERIKRPSGICTNRAGTQFYVSCYLAGCVRAFNISY
ncbi:unnamed protein product, partial [Adineta steineri]